VIADIKNAFTRVMWLSNCMVYKICYTVTCISQLLLLILWKVMSEIMQTEKFYIICKVCDKFLQL